MPPMSGRMRKPDKVGLIPFTFCKKSGRKVRAPNMANPMTKPMALADEKTRSPNSRSGMTGSLARCSARKKRRIRATPTNAQVTLCVEAQDHEMPPRLAKTINNVAPPESRTVPA